ncbi:MAG: hypothetical protein O7G85_06125, partial [Planctomycetota bacterium]|nr:hypothetical protein [Planctomycetota bacterium]
MRALKGRMPRTYVIDTLRRSVQCLAEVTGLVIHQGTFGVAQTFRDCSPQAQQERYQGGTPGSPGISGIPGTQEGGSMSSASMASKPKASDSLED